jgi:hypothetical protein
MTPRRSNTPTGVLDHRVGGLGEAQEDLAVGLDLESGTMLRLLRLMLAK